MTTKSALIARIADDLIRSDLNTQISAAIDDAIAHYQPNRFHFKETREATFPTVAGRAFYDADDDPDIALWLELDEVFIEDGSQRYRLKRCDPKEIELLSDASASNGRPYSYAYFDRGFMLYPIPGGVYTVRPMGNIERPAPASDGEENNLWMIYAFDLLRCHAKGLVALHVIGNATLALAMLGPNLDGEGGAAFSALRKQRRVTTKKVASGMLAATSF